MRFRCKIVDVSCVNHFTRVVNTITKLTKSCNLRLTANNLYFILTDKVANGGVSMWCELCQPSLSSTSRIVTHDIPVTVIPRRLWNDFKEPTVPHFDVSIYLPALKTMKSVVERMKNVSNFIVIEANRNGEMNLKIETDLASVSTHFKDLGNPPWVSDEPSQSDPDIMSEARVDIRKLLQFLAGQQVNPNKAICTVLLQAMFLLLPCPSAISCQRPLDTLMLLWISSVPQEVLYINGWSTLSYYMMMCPCSISFLLLPRWIHLVI
ncbi:checkpoint protein HUS1 isoform X7 [Hyla sarda]|uniref:checkpoint protein HUS1 isoform X7 n=1 Tax=Hyla sarda TaxID=327740 RepID=UPI0024C2A018|nr:checkpoint protein HUS1 isoform X7 [Hyla sarda]